MTDHLLDGSYRAQTVYEKQQWDREIHRHDQTVVQRWITVDTTCPYCKKGMQGIRGWVVDVQWDYPAGEADPLETHRFSCPHCSKTFHMEIRTPKDKESWWW